MKFRKKHGPNTWENYLNVHERVLRDFAGNFITQNPSYLVDYVTENYYSLSIQKLEIITAKGSKVFAKIEKDVLIEEGARKKVAQTYNYSYHAWLSNNENLIRYCGPHLDHRKYHHKHVYKNGKEIRVDKIGDDEWPHVSDFLQELIDNF